MASKEKMITRIEMRDQKGRENDQNNIKASSITNK